MKKVIFTGITSLSAVVGGYALYSKSSSNSQNKAISSDVNKPDMNLKLVQVVFRHGARTPLSHVEYLPAVDYHQDLLDHDDHTFVPYSTKTMDGTDTDIKQSIYRHKDKTYGHGKHGELTRKGAEQMYQLGCQLKKRYISELEFLPVTYTDDVVVRSTSVKRAVESARCTLAGLFPDQKSVIPIHIASLKSEIMFPNFEKCQYLKLLTRWCWFNHDCIEGLKEEREEIQTALGIPEGTKVHLVTLRDYLFALNHLDMLPDELNKPEVLKKAELAAVKIMDHVFSGHDHTRETALRLGIGPLLTLFMDNIQASIDKSSAVKMRMFSGHDTTIMPLLRALEIEENVWTPYGANIIFELYEGKNKTKDKEHFVRVLYQHQEQIIPGCKGAYCQLDDFRQALSKFLIYDDEHAEKCAVKDDHLLRSLPSFPTPSK